jgi:predicted protein tyrosine phosphatase
MTSDQLASPKPPQTPELLILSRKKAELYEPAGREACISITDPDDDRLPALSATFVAILRVAFSDIDESTADPSEILFNEGHARQVTDFVRHLTNVDRVVVHCMAGQSRSPGIALGLCELFSWEAGDLEERYPFWNPRVRSELVRIGRQTLSRT